jgi:DNA-binding CsgD family transcriptional regulator
LHLVAAELQATGVATPKSILGAKVMEAAGTSYELPATTEELYGATQLQITAEQMRIVTLLMAGNTHEELAANPDVPFSSRPTVKRFVAGIVTAVGARDSIHLARIVSEPMSEWSRESQVRRTNFDLLPSEATLLALMSRGWRQIQVAERFEVNPDSVRQYASRAYRKVGGARAAAVSRALGGGALLPDFMLAGVDPPVLRIIPSTDKA